MATLQQLKKLTAGTQLLVGGDRVVEISAELAEQFQEGDHLSVIESSGEILHIPRAAREEARAAVDSAHDAFSAMRTVKDAQISAFYEYFANALNDDAVWKKISDVNAEDVDAARARGRSTTRLKTDDKLRQNVIAGLHGWARAASQRGKVIETVQHDGWVAELVGAELGVVGFVFEGRPNVVADATGVLRGGNTVVFRIGRDALNTAKAILKLALRPALLQSGLPEGAVSLVDSPSHAAGWAMFSDSRLSLAVARGSGPAVATLGSLAQRAGVPVSLHGTGGAWIVAGRSATPEQVERAVFSSLDRKVCNTLNTLCLPESEIAVHLAAASKGLRRAAELRGHDFKVHVLEKSQYFVPEQWFEEPVTIRRAEGDVQETRAELIAERDLGHEWEWEESPEITLLVQQSTSEAVELFNRYSPQFVASLLSQDTDEHQRFYETVNAPFVGDGFTRWVDGQFALGRPELGLSNWERGRLFGRGGILAGDSVYTVRTRVRGT